MSSGSVSPTTVSPRIRPWDDNSPWEDTEESDDLSPRPRGGLQHALTSEEARMLRYAMSRLSRTTLSKSYYNWRKWHAHVVYKRELVEWATVHIINRRQARIIHAWHINAAQNAHMREVGATLVAHMNNWKRASAFALWNNTVMRLKTARKRVNASLRRMRSGLLIQAMAWWCEVHMNLMIMKDLANVAMSHWYSGRLKQYFADWRRYARMRRGKLFQRMALASHSAAGRLRASIRAWRKVTARIRRRRKVARAVAKWRNKCVLSCFSAWQTYVIDTRAANASPQGPSSPTPDREPGYLRVNPPTPWAVPAGLGSHHHHSHHQVPSRSPSPTTPFHAAAAAAATPFPPRTPFSAASVSNSNNNNNHYANINNRPSSRTSWYSMQSNAPSSRSGTPTEDAAAVAAAIAASEAAAATGGLAGNGAFVAALTKQFKRHMTRKYGAIETLVDASVHRVASEAKRRSLPQQRAAAVRLASARATAELSGVSPTGVSSANSSPSPTSSSRTMRWLDDDASGLDDHEKARARAWHAKRMARRKEHVLRRWMAVSNDGGTLGTLERASSPRGDDSMSSPGASPRTPPSAAESAAAEARARLSRSAASLSSAGGTVMTAVGAHPRIETSDPYELALWRMQDEANQLRRALESGGLSPMQVAMQCERLGARLSAARIGHSTPGSLRAL
ncbi:hypothetical protein NFJ02_31g79760 [Pycnococcus provasolii]